jgi:hypothetical protein
MKTWSESALTLVRSGNGARAAITSIDSLASDRAMTNLTAA